MPFDKSHHECLNGSGSYVAAKTPIMCSFSPFCAPFPPPKSHAPNQKPTQHHNGAYEDQNNELPNGVHRVRSYSDGEESMDRHKFHARAAWDDTLRCKRVARKSGEDLAPRKESSHQPNLHKGCRRVPLNTCMFFEPVSTHFTDKQIWGCRDVPILSESPPDAAGGGGHTKSGVDDTPMEPEAVEAAGRTGKKQNASAPGSSRQSTPIGSSKRRLYCFAERRAGKHWDLKTQ